MIGKKIYMRAAINANKDMKKIVIVSNSTKFMLKNPRGDVHDIVINVPESEPSKLSIRNMDTVDYLNGYLEEVTVEKELMSMKPGSQLAVFPFSCDKTYGLYVSRVLSECVEKILSLDGSYRILGCFIIDIDSMTAIGLPVKDINTTLKIMKENDYWK